MKELTPPEVILFDWHATLVDTSEAMYHAVDDVLPQLEPLGLLDRVINARESKTAEDAKLVDYVRRYRCLHPKVKADRKVSRTDIFEILFGADEEAKHIAHAAFNGCYRNHFGEVHPLEQGVREMLSQLGALGIKLGVLSNRDREFIEHELAVIDGCGWGHLFDTIVCGDDSLKRKPSAEPILCALRNLNTEPSLASWYVGDSTTDTVAAKQAGITSVFYNGAQWDGAWLDKIFPATARHPHKPDIVVHNFPELLALVWRSRRPRGA